jgi:rRNA processing protein Gar1
MSNKTLGKVYIDIDEEDAQEFLYDERDFDWRFPVYDKKNNQVGEVDIAIGRNVKDPHYEYDNITGNVIGEKDEGEKPTTAIDENDKIIRAWSDSDEYVRKVKTALGNIEQSTLKSNAINSISGSYAIAEITDLSTDVFDDETEVEIDNFSLNIRFGVKSDCDDWTNTFFERLDCETLELVKGSK